MASHTEQAVELIDKQISLVQDELDKLNAAKAILQGSATGLSSPRKSSPASTTAQDVAGKVKKRRRRRSPIRYEDRARMITEFVKNSGTPTGKFCANDITHIIETKNAPRIFERMVQDGIIVKLGAQLMNPGEHPPITRMYYKLSERTLVELGLPAALAVGL